MACLYAPYGGHLLWCIGFEDTQVFEHSLGGALAGAHGENHGGRAGDDVSAGEDAGQGGHAALFVDYDVAPLVDVQSGGGLRDDRVGGGSQGVDDRSEEHTSELQSLR